MSNNYYKLNYDINDKTSGIEIEFFEKNYEKNNFLK